MLIVSEVFGPTWQGEGPSAGRVAGFVRLGRCNLACTWCDTPYTWDWSRFDPARELHERSVDSILSELDAMRVDMVVVTGGEPLLQQEIYPLAERLLAAGYTVMIETSGERDVSQLPKQVIKIVDVKCPDSGEAETFDPRNLEAVDTKDEIKFVLSTRRDYEFAREFAAQQRLAERVNAVLFSPVFEDPERKWPGLEPRTLVEWILADGVPARLGLQLHKFVWDPATKGV